MLHKAGTTDYNTLTSTRKGLRAAAHWLMPKGLLPQFRLAAEFLGDLDREVNREDLEPEDPDPDLEEAAVTPEVTEGVEEEADRTEADRIEADRTEAAENTEETTREEGSRGYNDMCFY